jgi:hypothetical protein
MTTCWIVAGQVSSGSGLKRRREKGRKGKERKGKWEMKGDWTLL